VIGADVVVANIVGVIDERRWKCAEILKIDKPYRDRGVGCHLRVARRGVELGMPEQDLDHANVDVLLEQMGGEAVAVRAVPPTWAMKPVRRPCGRRD